MTVWTRRASLALLLMSPEVAQAAEEAGAEAAVTQTSSAASPSSAAGAVASATEAPRDESDDGPTNTAAVLGAASPEPPSSPYQLFLSLGLQVGTGTFIPAANRDLVGYSLGFTGLYRIVELFDGRLDAFAVLSADQSLTTSSADSEGSVAPREFFFRDVRIGLLGRSLLNDKATGIIVGANTSFDLPTSLQAQALGRIFRWNLSGNLARQFSEVGPGSLLLRLGVTARRDFADGATVNTSDAALCNSVSVDGAGNCLAGRTSEAFGLIARLSTTYFIGRFNIALGISFINSWRYSSSDSTVPDRLQAESLVPVDEIDRSPNAGNDVPYSLIISSNISVTYSATRHLLLTLGLSTAQSAVDKCNQDISDVNNDDGQCVQFPFFDFNNQTNNLSSFFFNTTLMY